MRYLTSETCKVFTPRFHCQLKAIAISNWLLRSSNRSIKILYSVSNLSPLHARRWWSTNARTTITGTFAWSIIILKSAEAIPLFDSNRRLNGITAAQPNSLQSFTYNTGSAWCMATQQSYLNQSQFSAAFNVQKFYQINDLCLLDLGKQFS